MAIQIGKYKRPGIFIEEFDQSVISSPTVEGITNLVMGVSRKGPVNTPIRLTNIQDLEAIFGQLDRNLERKGSFFHRTIAKMLETAPVYAMNLLLTDDNLDVIEYKSLSSSAGYKNDIKREGPYRRFFDTTGFWKRDTESFINLTKNNTGYTERAFNLTNLSDKPVTAFVFKSQLTGFDRTLLEWYGSVEKMPPYVNANDFAADYLVDVVVVGGDWSNYQELAVDPRWSQYFNASGLIKEQVSNFANDRNITLLSYYEGLSLIPYFRDLNGRNIFIETSINRDTDSTGLFCSFNNDLVEQDYYTGLLDLLGNTLVDVNETDIEFLSYKETISESVAVTNTPLDLPGNVTAMLGSTGGTGSYDSQVDHAFEPLSGHPQTSGILENGDNRTAWFGEGSVYNVTRTTAIVGSSASLVIEYVAGPSAFTVIGDTHIPVSGTTSLTISASDYTYTSSTASYTSTFVLDASGEIILVNSLTPNVNPSVNTSDVILGYIDFDVYQGQIDYTTAISSGMTDVTVADVAESYDYIDFILGTDYTITDLGSGSLKVEFLGTNTQQDVKNYEQYRRFKMFNRLVSLIDSPNKNKMTMLLNTSMTKASLELMTITDIVTSTLENKSFTLNTGLTSVELMDIITYGSLVFYTEDNEFILGTDSVKTQDEVADTVTGVGVVSKYSNLYSKYYDGVINTKDFFYDNRLYVGNDGLNSNVLGTTVNITLIDGENATSATSSYAGYDYIIFESDVVGFDTEIDLQTFEQLLLPGSQLNKGTFTIVGNSVNPSDSPVQLATDLGYTGGTFYAYQVTEEVESETLFSQDLVYNYNSRRHYLKLYLDNNGVLSVEFMDELLLATEAVDIQANNTFYIQSGKTNFKQTIEVELPTGYVQVPNKILIDGSRYTEVKVGDFLEAYYDPTTLEVGEVPRRLTRILSKRQYVGDASLTEVSCDSRIATYNFNGDVQTMRYVSIDQYASTYKAISMKGFKVRQASLPDGTEDKQNQVLNLVAKGTPMFKALINKEALDFRYLIDSFGLGLTERSKQQLVDICGDRLDAFGFLNMPSLRSFKNSSSPSFVDSEGTLQVKFVASGGDPESNPAFLYSFGDGAGVTTVGYFTPYVTVNDNGRPLEFPPASFAATTYMRKHISNITSVTPWTIAAGVTNGKITNTSGIEMDFTQEDIEYLNQAQMNPIVFKRNRGYQIETENTAQTLYKSALSYIHVREVLIELERELSRMLLDYQWKFNTPDVRAEIKLRADVICETYVSKNGLYNFFNKMDEENNTSEIIDNQIGVLDTYVEPIKGMGIIVNNITILRTGAISAGGFINS
jgi:hypothetical protein